MTDPVSRKKIPRPAVAGLGMTG